MLKDMDLSFAKNLSNQYGKKSLDTATKTGTNTSEEVIHKAAEAVWEFFGNKIADTVTKLHDDKIVKRKLAIDKNLRNAEETILPPGMRVEILNKLRQVL